MKHRENSRKETQPALLTFRETDDQFTELLIRIIHQESIADAEIAEKRPFWTGTG